MKMSLTAAAQSSKGRWKQLWFKNQRQLGRRRNQLRRKKNLLRRWRRLLYVQEEAVEWVVPRCNFLTIYQLGSTLVASDYSGCTIQVRCGSNCNGTYGDSQPEPDRAPSQYLEPGMPQDIRFTSGKVRTPTFFLHLLPFDFFSGFLMLDDSRTETESILFSVGQRQRKEDEVFSFWGFSFYTLWVKETTLFRGHT